LADAKSLTRVQFVNKHFYGLCWDDSLGSLHVLKRTLKQRLQRDKDRKKIEEKCKHLGDIYISRVTQAKVSVLYIAWVCINIAQYIMILLAYGRFVLPNFKDSAFQHAFLAFMILQIVCFYPTLARIVLSIRPFFFEPFKLSAEAAATVEPILATAFVILLSLCLSFDQTNPLLIAAVAVACLSFLAPIIAAVKIAWCKELLNRMYPDRTHQAKLLRLYALLAPIRKLTSPCGTSIATTVEEVDEMRKSQARISREVVDAAEAV
jgi:signal transduction histidine kinase